ncbi:MAG: hypothetical protein AAGB04_11265 [Pseudomonadota bacterium]
MVSPTTSTVSDVVDSRMPNSETSGFGESVWAGEAIPPLAELVQAFEDQLRLRPLKARSEFQPGKARTSQDQHF